MHTDFAVVYDAALTFMNKFNRVLHGDDMIFSDLVCRIDDGGKRGRFTASGGTGHHNQPTRQRSQFGDDRRKTELIGSQYLFRNLPENRCHSVFLHEKIGTVARKARNFIAEIDITGFLKHLYLIFRGDLIEHGFQFIVLQHLVFDPFDLPTESQGGLLTGNQMKVRGSLVVH